MKRGTALFMHRLTMHSSLRNLSNAVRWSFDLRYQPVGQPTGRAWPPAFVARRRADPSQEIRDWRRWADLWWQPRAYVAANPGAQKPRCWTGTEARMCVVRTLAGVSTARAESDLPAALGGDVHVVLAGLQVGNVALVAGTRRWHMG